MSIFLFIYLLLNLWKRTNKGKNLIRFFHLTRELLLFELNYILKQHNQKTQGRLWCLTNAINGNVWLILKVRKNTALISQMNFLYRTLTKREVDRFSLLFRQTCRLDTCMCKSFSWEKFGINWADALKSW